MRVGYNEIDPYCCAWLENLMLAGLLPIGKIRQRDRPASCGGVRECVYAGARRRKESDVKKHKQTAERQRRATHRERIGNRAAKEAQRQFRPPITPRTYQPPVIYFGQRGMIEMITQPLERSAWT